MNYTTHGEILISLISGDHRRIFAGRVRGKCKMYFDASGTVEKFSKGHSHEENFTC